jgi:hypothetical protein
MKIKKTKICFLIFIFTFLILAGVPGGIVLAGKAALTWTAPTKNSDGTNLTDLGGYKVYWGTTKRTGGSAPGGYPNSKDVGKVLTYTIDNIADKGTTYFSVTAYDASNNQSVFSSEVKKTPGDVDKNGKVDIFDYNTLKSNFGKTNCDNTADIDLNCKVDIFDYNTLKGNFGAQG